MQAIARALGRVLLPLYISLILLAQGCFVVRPRGEARRRGARTTEYGSARAAPPRPRGPEAKEGAPLATANGGPCRVEGRDEPAVSTGGMVGRLHISHTSTGGILL